MVRVRRQVSCGSLASGLKREESRILPGVKERTLGEAQRYFPPQKEETTQSLAVFCSQPREDTGRVGRIWYALIFSKGRGGVSAG